MYTFNQLIFPSYMEKNTRFFVIAGFSLNGPVGIPFTIREGVDPTNILGESRLTDNYKIAKQYGITPLILRLNGSHGECELVHDTLKTPVLRFKTAEATDECNNIQLHVFPDYLLIEGNNNSFSYLFADYQYLDDLVAAIKRDLYFGKGEVDVEVINQAPLAGLCTAEKFIQFDGADDGYNYVSQHDDSDTPEKMQLQLDLLKSSLIDEDGSDIYFTGELSSFQIDTLLFTDIPYEKAPDELTSILGQFAEKKTEEQSMFCSVVLGSDFFAGDRLSDEGEDTYVSQVQALLGIAAARTDESDYKKHVEVVIGTQESVNLRDITMPCAASYACMRYSLTDFYNSATNKAISSISALYSRELKQNEVAQLSSSGYICIVPSIKKGFIPYSSKNLYPQNTLHAKPHYLRSVHYDVGRITGFFNPYIGEPLSFTVLQNVMTDIQNFVNDLLDKHQLYKNITLELLDYREESFSMAISFELYGEIESISSSLEYVPSNEVNVSWQ